jgi:hypothetical protein
MLADFYESGVRAAMSADLDRAYRYIRTDAAAREALGAEKTYALERATLSAITEQETLQHTRMERRSQYVRYSVNAAILGAKTPEDYDAAQRQIDEAVVSGQLAPEHGVELSRDIFKMRSGGGTSDASTVNDYEYRLYRTQGSGVDLDEIRSALGHGLDSKDVTRLFALKETLEASSTTMTQARSYLDKMVMPGMLDKILPQHKAKLNIVMQELDAATNHGNMPKEEIWKRTFAISDRLAKGKSMLSGTQVFKSIDDLDKALRAGKIDPSDEDSYTEGIPIPSKWHDADRLKSWKKIAAAWRDREVSEEVALALYYRLFPEALNIDMTGGKK